MYAGFSHPPASSMLIGCHPSAIALYHLIKTHRANTKLLGPHLRSRNSSLSSRQYYRLMAMSMVLGIWGLAWISFEVQLNVENGSIPLPLPSWDAIHADDSVPLELPTVLLKPVVISNIMAIWYAIPGAGYFYFLFFGASQEVFAEYLLFWSWFRTRVLGMPVPVKSTVGSTIRSGYVMLLSPLGCIVPDLLLLTRLFSVELLPVIFCPRMSIPPLSRATWNQSSHSSLQSNPTRKPLNCRSRCRIYFHFFFFRYYDGCMSFLITMELMGSYRAGL
jgi:hypothetical protein